MNTEADASGTESGGMMSHLPLAGPAILLIVLAVVGVGSGDDATAVPAATPAPVASDAADPAAEQGAAVADAESESEKATTPAVTASETGAVTTKPASTDETEAQASAAAESVRAATPRWPHAAVLPAVSGAYLNEWAPTSSTAQAFARYGVEPDAAGQIERAPVSAAGASEAAAGITMKMCPPPFSYYNCVYPSSNP